MVDLEGDDGTLLELALFAGAGGGILGGRLLGWRTVCAVEINPYAASVLVARQNDDCLGPFPVWDDIRTFRSDNTDCRGMFEILRKVRHRLVVSGGFPCQDISVAGGGAGIDGDQSGLWSEYARVLREIRPRFAFMENSPALTGRGLHRVLGDLAEAGYDAEWGVVSCRDVGGVHLRERIWVLCSDNSEERVQGEQQKKIYRFTRFPWGEDVRGIEDLLQRSDYPKPLICRIGDDVSFGMDRLAALGNAQVPRVAAAAWRCLSVDS